MTGSNHRFTLMNTLTLTTTEIYPKAYFPERMYQVIGPSSPRNVNHMDTCVPIYTKIHVQVTLWIRNTVLIISRVKVLSDGVVRILKNPVLVQTCNCVFQCNIIDSVVYTFSNTRRYCLTSLNAFREVERWRIPPPTHIWSRRRNLVAKVSIMWRLLSYIGHLLYALEDVWKLFLKLKWETTNLLEFIPSTRHITACIVETATPTAPRACDRINPYL